MPEETSTCMQHGQFDAARRVVNYTCTCMHMLYDLHVHAIFLAESKEYIHVDELFPNEEDGWLNLSPSHLEIHCSGKRPTQQDLHVHLPLPLSD